LVFLKNGRLGPDVVMVVPVPVLPVEPLDPVFPVFPIAGGVALAQITGPLLPFMWMP
jgi:hypothetical protein